jgi:hypothetical protein
MTWPSPEVAERVLDAVVDIVAAHPRQWPASEMADHFLDVIRPDVAALDAAAERRGRVAALRQVALSWQTGGWADVLIPMPTQGIPSLAVGQVVTDWLGARADEEASRG